MRLRAVHYVIEHLDHRSHVFIVSEKQTSWPFVLDLHQMYSVASRFCFVFSSFFFTYQVLKLLNNIS